MSHAGFRIILLQAAAIVAVGSIIGVVDAFVVRPIQIGRPDPGPLEIPTPKPPPAGQTQPVASPEPKITPPVETGPQPTVPSPAPSQPSTPAAGCVPTPKASLPTGHISMDDAKALFDGGQAIFVDTRKKDIYEDGHVKGAYRIELHDFAAGDPQILNFIERSSVVVTYCVGGNCDESEAVARQLSGAGYQKVYVMHDGFPCWKGLGFPVETGAGMFP